MDRRQQKTRAAVYKAFTELLREKPYTLITIQDIIDRANIGRSTFYAHFETKDDLLNVLCADIFEHVFSEHLHEEYDHDFSLAGKGLIPELTHILYHLNDNRGYIRGILACESGEVFMRYFKDNLETVFKRELPEVPEGVPEDYYLHHLVSGFSDTVRWWMSNKGTPEEIVQYFAKLYL